MYFISRFYRFPRLVAKLQGHREATKVLFEDADVRFRPCWLTHAQTFVVGCWHAAAVHRLVEVDEQVVVVRQSLDQKPDIAQVGGNASEGIVL